MPVPDGYELLLGRLPGEAAPAWIGIVLLVGAPLALVPSRSRLTVSACWVVAALSGSWALLVSRVRVELPPGEVGSQPRVPPGALPARPRIAACLLALHALTADAGRRTGGSRQRIVAAVLMVAVAVVPVGGFAWWFAADSVLGDPPSSDVPAHIADSAADDPAQGVLHRRRHHDRRSRLAGPAGRRCHSRRAGDPRPHHPGRGSQQHRRRPLHRSRGRRGRGPGRVRRPARRARPRAIPPPSRCSTRPAASRAPARPTARSPPGPWPRRCPPTRSTVRDRSGCRG